MDGNAEKLLSAIAGLEAQRLTLGDTVVDSAIAALRERLRRLEERTDASAAEERKIVTIVFVDISGFTALSEKLDVETVRELINACFETLVPIVEKYQGTIDKFIGDEIMALFGAPVAHEDDPERALHASLEMMDAISRFNRARGTTLDLHIGINTGLVVTGHIGSQNRHDYSVMGDAVNLAARLEDASSVGEIFVGPATYRQTKRLFEFAPIPPLPFKGKEALVEVHRLIGLKAEPEPTRGIEGLRAPLVGRDAEVEEIRSAIRALEQRRGSVLLIVGEAGIGKSRLIAEARALLPANIRCVEARALSYTSGMNYWLAREMVLNLLGISPDTSPQEIAETLRHSIAKDGTDESFPYLASMLALPLTEIEQERVKFLSGEALQSRILAAVCDYVRDQAQGQPLALVWEDLHWCDPSSKQVYRALLPITREAPLLVLSAARQEESRDAAEQPGDDCVCRTLVLSPLTREESASLIRELLKIENLPERMRELILSRAEGNPFFLEELLRSLIDAGVVARDGSRITATREIESVEIPETVQGVLVARIDRLQFEQKQALQRASVIGRVFQERVLTQLYAENGRTKPPLEEVLDELQRREFIQSQQQQASETATLEEDEYIFKHAITHDVAYSSILLARRKELHQRTAQAIETLFPERLDELSATVGYHFERAENAERAAFYLGRAAERARATFANAEAIAFYRSAIASLERVIATDEGSPYRDSGAKLNEGLGDVLTLTGQHEDARRALERARSLLPASGEIARSRLYRKIGFSHSLQRHYRTTEEAFDQADSELEKSATDRDPGWWEEKVQIQLERMHLFYWQGMVAEMRQVADRYRNTIETNGTAMQRSKFLKLLALSLLMESRFRPSEECVALARRAVAASEGVANLSEACHVRFTFGLIQLWRCNFEEAITHCATALQLAERIGDLVLQARCLTYLALANRRFGDVERARTFAERTLALASQLGIVEYIAMAKANLAWVTYKELRLDDTEKLAREALDLWHGMEDPYSIDWVALWPLIATALARKQFARAVELAERFFLESQHPLHEHVMSATRRAVDFWHCGDAAQATSQMKIAMQIAERHHYI